MLLQRVLTAIPLAVLVLWIILFQPTEVFDYLLYAIATIAAYEWSRLSGILPAAIRLLYALTVLMVCVVMLRFYSTDISLWLWLAVIWWSFAGVRVFTIQPATLLSVSYTKMFLGVLIIPVAVMAMHNVHQTYHAEWLLYGLMLVWVADIGAYFAGRAFGKHKLASKVSPGKTIEGLIGALLATTVYSMAAAWYFELGDKQLWMLLLLSPVLTLISVVGDLYESVLKREFGVKDSGRILPGHGGILDRIDSVLAAMPVFALGMMFIFQTGHTQ